MFFPHRILLTALAAAAIGAIAAPSMADAVLGKTTPSIAGDAAKSSAFELPRIGDPGSIEHHPGKMIWADLVTPDLAAAEQFYGGLFGWTFTSIHAGKSDYAVALLGGHPIGGLVQRPLPAGENRQSLG